MVLWTVAKQTAFVGSALGSPSTVVETSALHWVLVEAPKHQKVGPGHALP